MLHQMGYPKNQSVCKSEYKWKRNKLWQILTSTTLGGPSSLNICHSVLLLDLFDEDFYL